MVTIFIVFRDDVYYDDQHTRVHVKTVIEPFSSEKAAKLAIRNLAGEKQTYFYNEYEVRN